jgi:S1-C subfamily serine protease
VNPGNSGGALVNARGELVGINSMIRTDTGGYQGISFAIPSTVARGIMKELIDHGAVRYGSIGYVGWQTIDRETAEYNGLGNSAGVRVFRIAPDSSAYQAGLRPGDLVTAVNGQKTPNEDQIGRLVIGAPVGSKAKFDVIRRGRQLTIEIPIVQR